MILPERTHIQHISVPALLTWQRSWYFIKIKYSEPNISAHASVSPLKRNWSTKPIIYIINNSLAFRYITSQIWKYYGIFGFVPNERGRIHEHKALHFPNSWVRKPLKYTTLPVRDEFRISTRSLSGCFVCKCVVWWLKVWNRWQLSLAKARPWCRLTDMSNN